MQEHVVLEDPRGQYWPGAVIPPSSVQALEGQGLSMMPIAGELLPAPAGVARTRRNGALGFFRRDYGAGWLLTPMSQLLCPMILYVVPGYPIIHWRARLVAQDSMAEGSQRRGTIRACPDTSQAGCAGLAISLPPDAAVDLGKLPAPDERGGWTVGGRVMLNATMEGYAGIALWGSCFGQGVRVAWSAISQAKE